MAAITDDHLLEHLTVIEEAAEDILTDKQQLIDLDRKRQKTREAIRALRTNLNTEKNWQCFGNMFIKLPRQETQQLLTKDYDELDAEINRLRTSLKSKVNNLRDLEHKSQTKGFNLMPLSRTEIHAIEKLL